MRVKSIHNVEVDLVQVLLGCRKRFERACSVIYDAIEFGIEPKNFLDCQARHIIVFGLVHDL